MPTPLDGPWYLDVVMYVTGLAAVVGALRVLRNWKPVAWFMDHAGKDVKGIFETVVDERVLPHLAVLVNDIAQTKDALDVQQEMVVQAQQSIKEIHHELTYDNSGSVKELVTKNAATLEELRVEIKTRFDHVDDRSHAVEGTVGATASIVAAQIIRLDESETKVLETVRVHNDSDQAAFAAAAERDNAAIERDALLDKRLARIEETMVRQERGAVVIATDLETAQATVEGVAEDLAASRSRADAESSDEPGAAADAGLRSDPNDQGES